MNIVVFGGTGLIGRAFCRYALMNNHVPIIVSRNPDRFDIPYKKISYTDAGKPVLQRMLSDEYAVVNLTGAGIANKRWSKQRKKVLERSRIEMLERIEVFLQQAPQEPEVFVQASAIGFYGDKGDVNVDEDSTQGNNYLSWLTEEWESAFKEMSLEDTRKVIIRTGIVLTKDGGVLPKMLTAYNAFVGGPLGVGNQFLSWIHIEDEVRAIMHLIEDSYARGAFNLTAPVPVTMKHFAQTLGAILDKSSFFRVPAFLLKLLFGQMAQETMLTGAKVLPKRLMEHEFEFIFTDVDLALRNLLLKKQ
ncbi:MAG: TIGR01777 family oxidoreductase [Salinivirgaceae bacterium]|jgi:uncharacterized protein (TIGR01777 family)|nr:TIGR01777 family oxidoreductase [Salinivirgaceae bacterium]